MASVVRTLSGQVREQADKMASVVRPLHTSTAKRFARRLPWHKIVPHCRHDVQEPRIRSRASAASNAVHAAVVDSQEQVDELALQSHCVGTRPAKQHMHSVIALPEVAKRLAEVPRASEAELWACSDASVELPALCVAHNESSHPMQQI